MGLRLERVEKSNANCHLLVLEGMQILFSYRTPVAGWSREDGKFVLYNWDNHSSTTTIHVCNYFNTDSASLKGEIARGEVAMKRLDR